MEILLSICIPTYNRAELLHKTIESIVIQDDFSEGGLTEIVILDNASTDSTEKICRHYEKVYPGKFKYFKNEISRGDERFEQLLRLATGKFLKLLNDNLFVRDGAIKELLRLVSLAEQSKALIFTLNASKQTDQQLFVCNDLNDFVKHVSFYSTWIGGFGIWRDDLNRLADFSRYADLQLCQTDVLLRLISEGRKAIVLNLPIFFAQNTGRKSGYNIAEVFGKNYLFLLQRYLNKGKISIDVYNCEKQDLLTKHIVPYYFDEKHDFNRSGFFKFLKDFNGDEYFFTEVENFILKTIKKNQELSNQIARPKGQESELRSLWRKLNAHNDTFLARDIDFRCISVGKKSYGDLDVWHWNHPNERLIIGDYVSISDGVRFLLGGNHPYQGFSTFPFRVKYFGEKDEAETKGPIIVNDDVWIGTNSLILSGVTIGQGAIIAAGSVVTRSIPEYAIAAGNPAKVIKYRFSKEVREALIRRLKYSKLTENSIMQNKSILYQCLDESNVHDVLDSLMNEGSPST